MCVYVRMYVCVYIRICIKHMQINSCEFEKLWRAETHPEVISLQTWSMLLEELRGLPRQQQQPGGHCQTGSAEHHIGHALDECLNGWEVVFSNCQMQHTTTPRVHRMHIGALHQQHLNGFLVQPCP